MTKKSKYILIQDTEEIFSGIGGGTKAHFNSSFTRKLDNYFTTLASSLRIAFNSQVDVQTYTKLQVERTLQRKVTNQLRVNPNTICICLDRYLLNDLESTDPYQHRFFRFHICRSYDDRKVPRQGNAPLLKQLENLKQSIPELDNKQLIIVDDGIFSGGTIKEFLELLSAKGIKDQIKKVIVFVCKRESLKDLGLVPLEVIEPVNNLYDWVNVRDFSPFGGKILYASKSNRVTFSTPYLYPWSDGASASLDMSPKLFTISQDMIKAFKELVTAYENTINNKIVTFREFVKSGFSLPSNLEKNIPISVNDSITEYLDLCIKLIQKEQNRKVVIFDMDGILYQLDGKHNGYHGSILEKVVLQNARAFIKTKEGCNNTRITTVLRSGLTDAVGLSVYLSKKYGINRLEYFNYVWNISPAGTIKNSYQVAETISQLKLNPQLKIVLLTSAPRIWAERVLDYLKITKFFESIYTGEQFGHKREVFTLLAGRYKPENIISVGDQYQTDIEPARKLGMRTLQVNNPKDLKQLLSILQ